jgi:uncharacterized tellurite resistance protein B-like protein
MSGDAFEKRRQAFEEEFFNKENQKLKDKLRAELDKQHTREELVELTGVQDPRVLDALMALNVDKGTFAAFALLPLLEVAWADGTVDDKERAALLAAAADQGITPGSVAHTMLQEVLIRAPREDALKAWYAWVGTMSRKLSAAERREVRESLVKRARAIAGASGGFLGLGDKISPKEQRVIDAIEKAFSD